MSKSIYGFAGEKHGKTWFTSPATKEDTVITCHDLSGFTVSHKLHEGGFFIESVSGESLCSLTMKMVQDKCNELNRGVIL